MKASELIEKLERLIQERGDWDVIAATEWSDWYDEEFDERVPSKVQATVEDVKCRQSRDGQKRVFVVE